MKRVWLVQRLEAPFGEANPFAFGGGMLNGGLSPEAMSLFNDIFSFDYMGSAEFEFGAIPTAFSSIAKLSYDNKLTTSFVSIGKSKVYILAPTDIIEEVKEWIKGNAKEHYDSTLKESTQLKRTLESGGKVKGWIKIERDKSCEEPFMFFTDINMFQQTLKMFKMTAGTLT